MECKYISDLFKEGLTLDLLYDYLDQNENLILSMEGIFFSKGDLQEDQVLTLEKVKKEIKLKKMSLSEEMLRFEEESGFIGDKNEMSISDFLDSSPNAIKSNGTRIYRPLDVDLFRKNREALYKNLEELEVKKRIENEIKSWETIKDNSSYLHKLVVASEIGGSPETYNDRKLKFVLKAKHILPDDSPLNKLELLLKLFDEISDFYMKTVSRYKDCKVIRNITLTSKTITGEVLYTHIDYAIVDDSGNLHIFNFKASSLYYGVWSAEKRNKYKLEQAFTKQMLSNNGLNIKNIQMNIVPIYLQYSEDFSDILSIDRSESISYEYNDKKEYIGGTYDFIARLFIKTEFEFNYNLRDLSQEELMFKAFFPSLEVQKDGIKKSAIEYIERAPSQGDYPLLISEINDGTNRYVVNIEGETFFINDYTEKSKNKKIIELVEKYLIRLNDYLGTIYANKIADAIKNTYLKKLNDWDFLSLKNTEYLQILLKPYLDYTTRKIGDSEEKEYSWEFIDALADSGILIFRNKDGQIDIVTLTTKNLRETPDFKYGTNILGSYLTDRDFLLKGNWGNIETIRTLILLNSIVKQMPEGSKLGTLHIISYQGQHMLYDMKTSVLYYDEALKKVLSYNKDLKYQNNLHSYEKIDEFSLVGMLFKYIVGTYKHLGTSLKKLTALKLKDGSSYVLFGEDWENDDEIKTKEQKRRALLSILEYFLREFPGIVKNPIDAIEKLTGYNKEMAKLYIAVSRAYLYYSGELVSYEEKLKQYERNLYTAPTVPDANIRIVVTNLQTTIDSIANDCDEEYSTNLRLFIMDYYKACGYTNIENFTLGTLNRLFEHLYQTDEKGLKTMKFKNPYTDSDLKPHERIFLKKALFFFNKYKFKDKQKYKDWNDPEIKDYIIEHNEYLNVPLKRASKSTRRQQSIGDRVSRLKRFARILFKTNGKEVYDEFVEKLSADERELYDEAFKELLFRDPYDRSEELRTRFIDRNGIDYFETNVEKLLIDRMFSSILAEKINRMLLGTKALLTQLKILGQNSGFEEVFEAEEKYIRDYIGLNVFKKRIVEGGLGGRIYGIGQGMRSNITMAVIAGNTISAARDIENGFMENYLRVASKHLTDITASNLSKAYAYVVRHASSDAMKINLLSKLCVRYRLSNTDTARITERLETNRQGLANWDNIAFSTLRSPDFLNRMTLFIARAMLDGVLDAWSIENDTLKYDWKKDKRFSVYADKSKKGTKEYKELQALYMLQIKEWNKDHPDNQLNYTDDLPTPYSDLEILSIKNLSNNIYGSYDKSLKSMGEFTAIGAFFGMYTTWMNGIWNNWMMKPGKYNIQKMKTELDTDINGNLLWLDEYGQITTENTGVPCLKHIPVIVLGIAYTLGDAFKIFKAEEDFSKGVKKALEYIKSDENTVASLKHAMLLTLLAIIFSILFKFIIDPTYEKTKKGYKDMNTLGILMSELTFKPLRPATDSFYGPLNILEYFGENTDPPMYNVPVKMVNDGIKTIFGDKTLGQFITGNFAVARIGKEVAKILAKQQA